MVMCLCALPPFYPLVLCDYDLMVFLGVSNSISCKLKTRMTAALCLLIVLCDFFYFIFPRCTRSVFSKHRSVHIFLRAPGWFYMHMVTSQWPFMSNIVLGCTLSSNESSYAPLFHNRPKRHWGLRLYPSYKSISCLYVGPCLLIFSQTRLFESVTSLPSVMPLLLNCVSIDFWDEASKKYEAEKPNFWVVFWLKGYGGG